VHTQVSYHWTWSWPYKTSSFKWRLGSHQTNNKPNCCCFCMPSIILSPELLCFSIILQSVTVMQWFLLFRMNFLCFKYSKCSLSIAAIVQSLLLIVHLKADIFLICIAISRKNSLFFFYIYIYPIFTVSFMVVQSGNRSISLWKIFSAQSASFPFLLRRCCFNLN